MKILFLCGYFSKENEEEVISHAKTPVEFSANNFQKKLIDGFADRNVDLKIISAPFIGSYPNASDIFTFTGFSEDQSQCEYVSFCNAWGIRNISRAKSLKNALAAFCEDPSDEKLIVVYSVHTPFLDAAVWAKKRDPRIKICMIVPDLPQYMNLNEKQSLLYKIGKKTDIRQFCRLNRSVDSYMLLTEPMANALNVGDRPYFVAEGIVSSDDLSLCEEMIRRSEKENTYKNIVYTGKLNASFGVKDLIDAFVKIDDPDYRLVLCGKGDAEEYIVQAAQNDNRIIFMGQLTPDEAKSWMYRADALVNPRKNNSDYTKYSFPSKNIEYLLTGNPVAAYMLDGMPEIYREFIYDISDSDLTHELTEAVRAGKNTSSFSDYAKTALLNDEIVQKIVDISMKKETKTAK